MSWLPKQKGLASAIVASGYGLSPFFLVQSSYHLSTLHLKCQLRPLLREFHEVYFTQPEIVNVVPELFLLLAAMLALILALGSPLLVKAHPSYGQDSSSYTREEHPLLDTNSSPTDYSSQQNMRARRLEEEVTPVQMLRKVSFYLFWFQLMLASSVMSFYIILFKPFGMELVTGNDQFLTTVGRFAAIFSALGGLVFGLFGDFVDSTSALVLQSALISCLTFTLYATSFAGKAMYFIWTCGIFFCIGGYYSLYPSAIAKHYGTENFSVNFGIVGTSGVLGQLIMLLVSQLLLQHFRWYGAFFVIGGLSSINCILAILLKRFP